MEEIWKDVVGYSGLYMVSTFGNVKSTERNVKCNNNGGIRVVRERILKPCLCKNGYLYVNLHKNLKSHINAIHSLMATAFIYNDNNKHLVVNHKNGIRTNNYLYNFELITQRENIIDGIRRRKNRTSKCVGVHYDKIRNKWKSTIFINGKSIFIGRFITEIDAKMAHKDKIKLYGLNTSYF